MVSQKNNRFELEIFGLRVLAITKGPQNTLGRLKEPKNSKKTVRREKLRVQCPSCRVSLSYLRTQQQMRAKCGRCKTALITPSFPA